MKIVSMELKTKLDKYTDALKILILKGYKPKKQQTAIVLLRTLPGRACTPV
jgi:hypothetical protein